MFFLAVVYMYTMQFVLNTPPPPYHYPLHVVTDKFSKCISLFFQNSPTTVNFCSDSLNPPPPGKEQTFIIGGVLRTKHTVIQLLLEIPHEIINRMRLIFQL